MRGYAKIDSCLHYDTTCNTAALSVLLLHQEPAVTETHEKHFMLGMHNSKLLVGAEEVWRKSVSILLAGA